MENHNKASAAVHMLETTSLYNYI